MKLQLQSGLKPQKWMQLGNIQKWCFLYTQSLLYAQNKGFTPYPINTSLQSSLCTVIIMQSTNYESYPLYTLTAVSCHTAPTSSAGEWYSKSQNCEIKEYTGRTSSCLWQIGNTKELLITITREKNPTFPCRKQPTVYVPMTFGHGLTYCTWGQIFNDTCS